jgi:C-terminal binding protein
MKKIFITDYIKNSEIEQKIIGNKAQVICLNKDDEKDFPDEIKDADGILVWHTKISEFTIQKLKKCKAVIRYGVGSDNIDRKSLKKYKIPFANTPDYGVDEVADTASAFILNLVRKVGLYDNQTKEKLNEWQDEVINIDKLNPIKRTSEHKLGIIGLGRIGSALALRMKSFKMKVGFYDPHIPSGYEKVLNIKKFETLEELAEECSIISVNAALNDETYKLINDKFINLLKNNSILINTARGAIIENLDVIMRGLKSNKLAAVGLDVLPKEPPQNSEPLIKAWMNPKDPLYDRIIINPHSAYYSSSSINEMRTKASQNMLYSLTGQRLRNIVNFE